MLFEETIELCNQRILLHLDCVARAEDMYRRCLGEYTPEYPDTYKYGDEKKKIAENESRDILVGDHDFRRKHIHIDAIYR